MTKQINIEQLIESLRLRLRDYAPGEAGMENIVYSQSVHRFSIDRKDVPVPNLLYFVLAYLLEFSIGARPEKTHWLVPFRYRGCSCVLSYEKFGLQLYVSALREGNPPNPKEIVGKLQKALLQVEKQLLEPFARQQIIDWNVTVANHYHMLRGMYEHFREQASLTFKRASEVHEKTKNLKVKDFSVIVDRLNQQTRAEWEGFYNTVAMVNSYFSWLEHVFVFCLPFASPSVKNEDLASFIGATWADKYKRILHIDAGSPEKSFYDRLLSQKERLRNIFSHGGFEKERASFSFHLPGIGAVPATMTHHRKSPHFHFIPVPEQTFDDVCALFDEFDSWLASERMPRAIKYAESGLDLPLDKEFLNELLRASEDASAFDEWLERKCYEVTDLLNADY